MNRNFTALILIIVSIGIYYTVTKSMYAEVKAIREVNAQYTTAIRSAEQLIRVRDQVLEDYNSLSDEDRDRLEKMIPSTVDNIRLIIDLNSVALRHGFTLRNIRASASNQSQRGNVPAPAPALRGSGQDIISKPTLDTVTVSFGVTAPYGKFITFLQDLEASLRIMDVTHLSLSSSDTGTYDFSVELKTYWMRQ